MTRPVDEKSPIERSHTRAGLAADDCGNGEIDFDGFANDQIVILGPKDVFKILKQLPSGGQADAYAVESSIDQRKFFLKVVRTYSGGLNGPSSAQAEALLTQRAARAFPRFALEAVSFIRVDARTKRDVGVLLQPLVCDATELCSAMTMLREDSRHGLVVVSQLVEFAAALIGSDLLHGDLHASNVLLAGDRLYVVDWGSGRLRENRTIARLAIAGGLPVDEFPTVPKAFLRAPWVVDSGEVPEFERAQAADVFALASLAADVLLGGWSSGPVERAARLRRSARALPSPTLAQALLPLVSSTAVPADITRDQLEEVRDALATVPRLPRSARKALERAGHRPRPVARSQFVIALGVSLVLGSAWVGVQKVLPVKGMESAAAASAADPWRKTGRTPKVKPPSLEPPLVADRGRQEPLAVVVAASTKASQCLVARSGQPAPTDVQLAACDAARGLESCRGVPVRIDVSPPQSPRSRGAVDVTCGDTRMRERPTSLHAVDVADAIRALGRR